MFTNYSGDVEQGLRFSNVTACNNDLGNMKVDIVLRQFAKGALKTTEQVVLKHEVPGFSKHK